LLNINNISIMKIIIVGSKGFIGQNIYNHFIKKGNDIWCSDILTEKNNVRYFRISSDNPDFNKIFKYLKYDLCINCSGVASVPDSLINPINDYYLNTLNVLKIIEAIKSYQPDCRFINLSSAAVYGDPYFLPVKEEIDPKPLSPYGFHKLHAEQICKEYWTLYGIRTCSLRIFSVYGPGLQKQLFWDIFQKAKLGVPFTLSGNGNESRDFIYITDLVRAIELVAASSDFESDIVNIANGEEIFIKEAVSIFFSFFNKNIRYSFSGDSRIGYPVNWVADIGKLCSFGYRPSIDMRNGLRNYYEWLIGRNILK
jgi:UDP-glucose 4-epimerase